MEVREFAHRIVVTRSVETKLLPARQALTDKEPGRPLRLEEPCRESRLRIVSMGRAKVPALPGMRDLKQKPRILHAFANHELQAAELFAWALLAFPDAPRGFRSGLLKILDDEQRHCQLYRIRLRQLGVEFGDFPVSGYFWSKVPSIRTPLQFVCAMSLTFENANLDHTLDYAREAALAGDPKTAALIRTVHHDEIEHVRFGFHWLSKLKAPEESLWEAYSANVTYPLRGALASGQSFYEEPRVSAGLTAPFIEALRRAAREEEKVSPTGPSEG